MAIGAYIGVNGVARKITQSYVGVGGVARTIKKGYIGVNGVARLCYSKNPRFLLAGSTKLILADGKTFYLRGE